MLDFYLSERADDVDVDADGDMLLFQWGTYDWGDGPSFQYDLTRQFITETGDEPFGDESFWQLSLVLHFEPNAETTAVGSGDRWCNGLSAVDELRRFINDVAASTLAQRFTPSRTELRFGPAG